MLKTEEERDWWGKSQSFCINCEWEDPDQEVAEEKAEA